MFSVRPYLNTDAPQICEIWRGQNPIRGRAQRLTMENLEQLILSKPYFDRNGFLVATYGNIPVGFVHASFGPCENYGSVDCENGIISMLMINPIEKSEEVSKLLLDSAIEYLKNAGASTLHAIGCFPNNPFYLGLYGGSRLAGVLENDEFLLKLFQEAGFEKVRTQNIYQYDLSEFRPKIDRQQIMVKRTYEVQSVYEPVARNWWQACTLGDADQTRFEIVNKDTGENCGEITFWDMLPICRDWGFRCNGMYDLEIVEDCRQCGIATFLVCEALKHLKEIGISAVEVQAPSDNVAAVALFEKLGFRKVEQGFLMQKTA